MSAAPRYEAVIGLEVHAQLLTRTKIFCGCSTRFGSPPNTQVCPVCLGLPGALPVLNEGAVRLAVRAALALDLSIAPRSVFARKNYFYPDLPKGYQISQYDEPVARNGSIGVSSEGDTPAPRTIRIHRLHLEEDAGKSFHPQGGGVESLIDLNRCGVPLIEIVSEPDLRTPREAAEYLTSLKEILEYTEVCDGNMEEGSLRCDVNISVRPAGESKLGVKTEIKNLNSIKSVAAGLAAEIERQSKLLAGGGRVVQETLLWDAKREIAVAMRSKEEAHDYRYFPEPDLHPLVLSDSFVEEIRRSMPELPAARRARLVDSFHLTPSASGVLTATRGLADYFEQVAEDYRSLTGAPDPGPTTVTWIQGPVLEAAKAFNWTAWKRDDFNSEILPSGYIAALQYYRDRNEISHLASKDAFRTLHQRIRESPNPGSVARTPKEAVPEVWRLIQDEGLVQISDEGVLRDAVRRVVAENPDPVAQFRAGKEKTFAFLLGQVMKATRGSANPAVATALLREEIAKVG